MAFRCSWSLIWDWIRKLASRHSQTHSRKCSANKRNNSVLNSVEIHFDRPLYHVGERKLVSYMDSSVIIYRLVVLWRVSSHTIIFSNVGDSIMLVEPGMLLIYRSADSRPWMTDMLVEYLDNYARQFDSSKKDDALLSI